jgi:hypothetical protein
MTVMCVVYVQDDCHLIKMTVISGKPRRRAGIPKKILKKCKKISQKMPKRAKPYHNKAGGFYETN